MAKLECSLTADFDAVLHQLKHELPDSSTRPISPEDGSDFCTADVRCAVRVFVRYSMLCKTFLTLTVTLFQHGDEPIQLSAIVTGGDDSLFGDSGKNALLKKFREVMGV